MNLHFYKTKQIEKLTFYKNIHQKSNLLFLFSSGYLIPFNLVLKYSSF